MPSGGKRFRSSKTRLTPLQDTIIRSILLEWAGAEPFRELAVTGVRDSCVGGKRIEASQDLPARVAHAVVDLVTAGYLRVTETASDDLLRELLELANEISYNETDHSLCCDADLQGGPCVWTTKKAERAYAPDGKAD